MNRYFLFCFFLFSQIILKAQDFPSYVEVVKRCAVTYNIFPGVEARKAIAIEKRADGYYVGWKQLDALEMPERELFWSAAEGVYNELKTLNVGDAGKNQEVADVLLAPNRVFRYEAVPFYGYRGWEMDVIDFLEQKKERNAEEDYALGRAYSSLAQTMINIRQNHPDTTVAFSKLPAGQNVLSQDQLDAYRNIHNLALAAKKRAMDSGMSKNTLVGSITTDYSNEVMTGYLNLRLMQNIEEARKELRKDLYSKEFLNHAANMLISCPQDAILFTFGDNDTYPLLYLQEVEKLRQDVTVINVAYLSIGRYANHFRTPIFKEKELKLTGKPSFYEASYNTLVRPYLLNKDTLSFDAWMFTYREREPDIANGQAIFIASSKYIRVPIGATTVWVYGMNGPLYGHNIFMLDAIASNRDVRPICLASTVTLKEYLPLLPYLEWRGLVFQLNPKKSKLPINEQNPVVAMRQLDTCTQLVMNRFRWTPEMEQIHDHGQKSFISYTQYLIYDIARQYNELGQKTQAAMVLDKYFTHYPVISHDDITLGYYLWTEYQKCSTNKATSKRIAQTLANQIEAIPPANWHYYKILAEELAKQVAAEGWNEMQAQLLR